MKITKKNGNLVLFDDEKVAKSILKANAETGQETVTEKMAYAIANDVFSRLTAEQEIISTQDIRSCVNTVLLENGLPLTARQYMEYKK